MDLTHEITLHITEKSLLAIIRKYTGEYHTRVSGLISEGTNRPWMVTFEGTYDNIRNLATAHYQDDDESWLRHKINVRKNE